jgi:hypothetical protein
MPGLDVQHRAPTTLQNGWPQGLGKTPGQSLGQPPRQRLPQAHLMSKMDNSLTLSKQISHFQPFRLPAGANRSMFKPDAGFLRDFSKSTP